MIRFELSKRPNMAQHTQRAEHDHADRRPGSCRRGAARAGAAGARPRRPPPLPAGDHHDLDAAAAADDLVEQRAPQAVAPARVQRLAHHDAADVALAREREQRLAHARAGERRRLRAQVLRQLDVSASACRSVGAERRLGGALHVGHDPLRLQPRGHPPGGAHQAVALGVGPHADQDPLRHRPGRPRSRGRAGSPARPRPRARPCAAAPARAARAGCRGGRSCWTASRGALRHVDLALREPLEQLLRRQVHELDLVGRVEDAGRAPSRAPRRR